jgi:hypothetical protein
MFRNEGITHFKRILCWTLPIIWGVSDIVSETGTFHLTPNDGNASSLRSTIHVKYIYIYIYILWLACCRHQSTAECDVNNMADARAVNITWHNSGPVMLRKRAEAVSTPQSSLVSCRKRVFRIQKSEYSGRASVSRSWSASRVSSTVKQQFSEKSSRVAG